MSHAIYMKESTLSKLGKKLCYFRETLNTNNTYFRRTAWQKLLEEGIQKRRREIAT